MIELIIVEDESCNDKVKHILHGQLAVNRIQLIKNKLIEVNTTLKFEDKEANEKKSYYEIVHSTVISVSNDVKEKKDFEKIILCDVPTAIYPNLETSFLNLIHNSGHPNIKLEKKVDFQKLYSEKFN